MHSLVPHDAVVVLATSVTAAAGVLAVLADAAVAGRHVAALLAVGLEACNSASTATRQQGQLGIGGSGRPLARPPACALLPPASLRPQHPCKGLPAPRHVLRQTARAVAVAPPL